MAVDKNESFGVEYDELIEQGIIKQNEVQRLVKLVRQEELLVVARTIVRRRILAKKKARHSWECDREDVMYPAE